MHQVSLHMQMLSPNVSNPHCIPFLKPVAAALSPWPSSSWLLEMHMWKSMPEKSSNLLPLWTRDWYQGIPHSCCCCRGIISNISRASWGGGGGAVAASGDSVHPLVVGLCILPLEWIFGFVDDVVNLSLGGKHAIKDVATFPTLFSSRKLIVELITKSVIMLTKSWQSWWMV